MQKLQRAKNSKILNSCLIAAVFWNRGIKVDHVFFQSPCRTHFSSGFVLVVQAKRLPGTYVEVLAPTRQDILLRVPPPWPWFFFSTLLRMFPTSSPPAKHGYSSSLTPLEPQSRFGDTLLEIWVVCPQNETVALKGLRGCCDTSYVRTRYHTATITINN